MLQTLVKKSINCLIVVLILLTCTSCKAVKPYKIEDYLEYLASCSGLNSLNGFEETVNNLINWNVINEDDLNKLEDDLTYDYLANTICHLIEYEGDYLEYLNEIKWIKCKDKNALVEEEIAKEVVNKAVNVINNKDFEKHFYLENKQDVKNLYDYEYDDDLLSSDEELTIGENIYLENDGIYKTISGVVDNKYQVEDVDFENVIEELDISGSFDLDFEDSIDIPGGIIEDDTSYVNNSGRNLLSSSTKSKTFSTDGFRVSYSFKRSGINARISKKIGKKNVYFDLSLTNIKPTYKWDYKDGVVNEAYLKVDYNSTETLGVSIGKYKNYTLDFSDKDTSSIMNYLKSVVKQRDDEVEATIKICEIKTPIPDMPTVYFNVEVLAKIYTTGKAELVLYNKHTKGLEVKNNTLRTIHDSNRDLDVKIGGSARACLGLNFNLQAVDKYLMDIEIDAGVRAAVSSTIHIYDSKGDMNSVSTDMTYSTLDDVTSENENIKVCGDVSLNWVLDLYINTSRTLLHKFALWDKKSILDEDNQLFNNKTHTENGVFVKSCTRKNKFKTTTTTSSTKTSIDKLILSKHNAVISLNSTYQIEVTNLPSGYKLSDLRYKSINENIVSVDGSGVVSGKSIGASDIEVTTSDGKYLASINILVSRN